MSILANNDSDDVVLIGKYVHKQKLYILDCSVNIPEIIADKCFAARDMGSNAYTDLMHKRLGHASAGKMTIMHTAADGVKQMNMKPHNCKVCAEMKSKTAPRSKRPIPKASRPLEKIYIDEIGPFPVSERGYRYACTITDSYKCDQ